MHGLSPTDSDEVTPVKESEEPITVHQTNGHVPDDYCGPDSNCFGRDKDFCCNSEEKCNVCKPRQNDFIDSHIKRSGPDDYRPVFLDNDAFYPNYIHYPESASIDDHISSNKKRKRELSPTDADYHVKTRRTKKSDNSSESEINHSRFPPEDYVFLSSKFPYAKHVKMRHDSYGRESLSPDAIAAEYPQVYLINRSPVQDELSPRSLKEYESAFNATRRSSSPTPTGSSCSSTPAPPMSPMQRKSPSGPFSPTTPVPMCLPIPSSSCESFCHPQYGCSVPSPCFQRFPYYFPSPFLTMHSEMKPIPFSACTDPKELPYGTNNIDARRPSKVKQQKKDPKTVSKNSSKDDMEMLVKAKGVIRNQKEGDEHGEDKTVKRKSDKSLLFGPAEENGSSIGPLERRQSTDENENDLDEKVATSQEDESEKFKSPKGRKFTCKFCGKVYVSLGALKMHIRTHTLPCKCHICGKAFSRPWLLQGHIRTHTGEKPYKCHMCQRAFADRSNLRAHLQTHSDVKKYSCGTCHKTFSRMSLLLKHEEAGCLVS